VLPPFDYLRDPEAIYRRSFELARAASDLSGVPEELHGLALRLVHACGMPEILDDLAWGGEAAAAGRRALEAGAPVVVDCRMLAEGTTRARLPASNEVLCFLNDPSVPELAMELATTRSAAAVELWRPCLEGAVVAIGNAPTALFRLLELLGEGAPRPAALLAFPVGFVGAAESKEALIEAGLGIPYVTLRGRRGGSALAAAAVNALAAERP
jgi:precorrin-8X/cobalt-precorrin-8 methylmutase